MTRTDHSESKQQLALGGLALRVLAALVTIEVSLFALDFFISHREVVASRDLQALFDITHEDTIGTWVSTTQYLALAFTAWLLRLRTRNLPDAAGRARGWGVLAVFFAYMSFDDGSRFHERIGSLFGDHAADIPAKFVAGMAGGLIDWFPSYNWQLAFFPVFASAGLFLVVFLGRELRSAALHALVLGGLSCWVFAVFLDFLEGASEGMSLLQAVFGGSYRATEHIVRAVEETVELFGATLMLTAFTEHLSRVADGWSVRFSANAPVARVAEAPAASAREHAGVSDEDCLHPAR
jgi:hypothetical protein